MAGLDLLQQGLAGVCPDEATGYALDNAARVLLLSAKASDDILSDATKRELTECVTCIVTVGSVQCQATPASHL